MCSRGGKVTVTTKLVCGASGCTYGSEFKYGMIPDQLGHQIIQVYCVRRMLRKNFLSSPVPPVALCTILLRTKPNVSQIQIVGIPLLLDVKHPKSRKHKVLWLLQIAQLTEIAPFMVMYAIKTFVDLRQPGRE